MNGNFSLVAHEDGIVAIVGDPCLSFSYKAKLDDLMVSQKSFSVAIIRRKLADFFIFLREREEIRSTATNYGLLFSLASKTCARICRTAQCLFGFADLLLFFSGRR